MLKKRLEQYLTGKTNEGPSKVAIGLLPEEKQYMERYDLLNGSKFEISLIEPERRFEEAYIERGDKETEEFLGEESAGFLKQPISYFNEHKNEFMYLESQWWDIVGVDAVSFEADDVFGTYDVMLGLKLQKKYENQIKSFIKENIEGEDFDLMFDGNEGIWSLNFALNNLHGYSEEMSIAKAYSLIYSFLFRLAEHMEKTN